MDAKAKARLQTVLNEFQGQVEWEQMRIKQERLAEVIFAQQFDSLRRNIVLPAFVDVEDELRLHGHRCRIYEFQENSSAEGDGEPVSIRCEFYPDGWDRDEGEPMAGPPSITITCEPAAKTVKIQECTFGPIDGGWSSEIDAYPMKEVTKELIADAFVAMVEKILLDKSFIGRAIENLTPVRSGPRRRVA